jgi:2-oxoglutarate dehydrogenase E2 component (dihydrolipoamide succinyltransferase)
MLMPDPKQKYHLEKASTPAMKAEQLLPLTSTRKAIAEHMVKSKRTSAHVTTVMEADLTNVVRHRAENLQLFQRDHVRLTFTPYFLIALSHALRKIPVLNSSLTEKGLVLHSDINIGMAVSLGEEGLIVPVIHKADSFSLMGMARKVSDLADRARKHKLTPDEVTGGTFSLTNHGTGGSLFATPIINQPQVGILGVGMIQKRAVVIQDAIAIRQMVYLSLTFDHRIIDGSTADEFLSEVIHQLQK